MSQKSASQSSERLEWCEPNEWPQWEADFLEVVSAECLQSAVFKSGHWSANTMVLAPVGSTASGV